MTAALHLPSRAGDAPSRARAAARGIVAVPLSRYATDASVNGLLLGLRGAGRAPHCRGRRRPGARGARVGRERA
jgi:hypothetical protein